MTILNIKTSNQNDVVNVDKQMIMAFDLIKTKFGNLTIPEIKEAFKMYVSKEFPEIKVFRMLDCVAVGEVLNAFTTFRADTLRSYSQKKQALLYKKPESNEDDKIKIRESFLNYLFEDLKENKFSKDAWILFEELEASEKLTISLEEKKAMYQKELQKYLLELSSAALKNPTSTIAENDLQNARSSIKKGIFLSVVKNRCRSFYVSTYLKDYLSDFERFKILIEK